MTDTKSISNGAELRGTRPNSTYVRWGGLAAVLGPLLVLSANVYGMWANRAFENMVEAATTSYVAFGGVRLLGGMLVVFGLVSLYACQAEAAGRTGLVGFVVSMVGSVLLTAAAWGEAFVLPVLARHVPEFYEAVMAGEAGTLLAVGVMVPLVIQAIGWTIFGIATYRAGVFPRRAAVVLVVGALLLFVPVQGSPIVFQIAVAWLGFLVFTGRVETPSQAETANPPTSESVGS